MKNVVKKIIAVACMVAVVGCFGIIGPTVSGDVHAASSKIHSRTVSKSYKTQSGKVFLTVKSTVKFKESNGKIHNISATTGKPSFSNKNAAGGMITPMGYKTYKCYTNKSKTVGYAQVAWPYASANGAVFRSFDTSDGYFYVDVKFKPNGSIIKAYVGQMTPSQYKCYHWGRAW